MMNLSSHLFMVTLLSVLSNFAGLPALAATYYVDPDQGRDQWAGTVATANGPPPTNGPWQSLARVRATALQAGDAVLLKCGGTWNETLDIGGSGTAASPITVSNYPAPCAIKPTIDGSVTVPAAQWARYQGNIYKATLPVDSVNNGNFANGLAGWSSYSPARDQTLSLDSTCAGGSAPCLALISGTGPYNTFASGNVFSLAGGASYVASLSFKAPVGIPVWMVVRRSSTPYEALGMSRVALGTGAWVQIQVPFVASTTVPNARLDIEIPPGRIDVRLDDAHVLRDVGAVTQVFADGNPVNLAHFPNRGYDASQPDSPYLLSNANADRVPSAAGTGSSYLATGPELQVPAGVTLKPGIRIRARVFDWLLEERTLASIAPGRLVFNQPTSYPLTGRWGYYLVDDLWMLDEPGEWYYDRTAKALFLWMPDGTAPGARVSVSALDRGLNLERANQTIVDGLEFRKTKVGITMSGATGVTVQNSRIADTLADGVVAEGTDSAHIVNNRFDRIGTNAIDASSLPTKAAINSTVTDNQITNSGVLIANGKQIDLPVNSLAAIIVDRGSIVNNNTVTNAGYIGIHLLQGGTAQGNIVSNACFVLDDCGAIYVSGSNNSSSISNNIVTDIIGNTIGKPAGSGTLAKGIYLDNQAAGIQVLQNTVMNADTGIHLHNANSNRVESNTLYGNRVNQLWAQETDNRVRTTGDIFGNQFIGNLLFPTTPAPAVQNETIYGTTTGFGTFDRNRYSQLLAPPIVAEQWATGGSAYTFPQWQAARTTANFSRNLDPNGSAVASIGYATVRVNGTTFMPNGDMAAGASGWTSWNQTTPFTVVAAQSLCAPVGRCLTFVAGASESLLSTPNFGVVKDQWYRMSLDIKTGVNGQAVSLTVRRGGGGKNLYEGLGSSSIVTGTQTWQRHSFVFQATKTVNAHDPVTLDLGARLDFERVMPGQSLAVANVEIVPLSPVQASLKTRLVINPSGTAAGISCPDAATAPAVCSQYVRFSNGAPALWPMQLPAKSAEVVYSRDQSLTDADSDGIADSQDACPNSIAAVNAQGCALGQ